MKDGKIEAEDLMIGDWVIGLSNAPRRVEGVRDYNSENVVLADHWVNCNNIEPIPLTPEILEKNGFEYFGDKGISCRGHEIMRDRTNEYEYSKEQFFFMNIGAFRMRIRYVHELQHALRLCGLNDLAVDFKI